MKKLVFIVFVLTTFCSAQKIYQFDHLIEYEETFYGDSLNSKGEKFTYETFKGPKYYLTNSKNNSYGAYVRQSNDSKNELWSIFRDENGIIAQNHFSKVDFLKADVLLINCEDVQNYENPFDRQLRYYVFYQLKDTVIEKKKYHRYEFAMKNAKRARRKKAQTEMYIIDPETAYHKPIPNLTTSQEFWEDSDKIPDGIFYERTFIHYDGSLFIKEKLVSIKKVNRQLIIPDACDYINNPEE
jgi:hypothetical protein